MSPPPGSVVVLLQRPAVRLDGLPELHPSGPWLLTARDDMTVSAIEPTPELEAMMPGREGLFHARRVGEGWEIVGAVEG